MFAFVDARIQQLVLQVVLTFLLSEGNKLHIPVGSNMAVYQNSFRDLPTSNIIR